MDLQLAQIDVGNVHVAPDDNDNMGKLRVDILDGVNLPSADHRGLADHFCKFILNESIVFKTKAKRKPYIRSGTSAIEFPRIAGLGPIALLEPYHIS